MEYQVEAAAAARGARNTESQTDSMAETVTVVHADGIPARAKMGTDFSHGDPTTANTNISFPEALKQKIEAVNIIFEHIEQKPKRKSRSET